MDFLQWKRIGGDNADMQYHWLREQCTCDSVTISLFKVDENYFNLNYNYFDLTLPLYNMCYKM